MFFKFATGSGNVVGIENRGNDADALCASGNDFVNVTEIDATDGKPGDGYVGGSPADVVEGNRLSAWLCSGGINRPDGDVTGARSDCFAGLLG